jgi:hypothetical protein
VYAPWSQTLGLSLVNSSNNHKYRFGMREEEERAVPPSDQLRSNGSKRIGDRGRDL